MAVTKTVSELRNKYDEIAELCRTSADTVIITRNGKSELAVMSYEDYEKLNKYLDTLNGQLDELTKQINDFDLRFDAIVSMPERRPDFREKIKNIDREFDRIISKFRKS